MAPISRIPNTIRAAGHRRRGANDDFMTTPTTIRTRRLALIPATPDLAHAELHDPTAFSGLLGAVVPGNWPPHELSDARLLFLCMLEANPTWIGWLGWYAVECEPNDGGRRSGVEGPAGAAAPRPPTLVGSVGFKGPPDKTGNVEIGYSVLPAHEGRGLATEMAAALLEWAAAQGARLVHAEVGPANPASVRVLEKLGFREAGAGHPPGSRLYVRETGPIDIIHRDVDEGARALEAIHRDRLRCRLGCCFCCLDEITVFEVEAEWIRRHYQELLATGEPHPVGACAFLDAGDGACRIYQHRPYVCRTQGLPLRWEDEAPTGEPAEFRDICPVNEAGPAVEELPAEECWEIGPIEERLAALQGGLDKGRLTRIRLRGLFAQAAPDSKET